MGSISKVHEKCEKCEHKNDCDNKRMAACAYFESQIDLVSISSDYAKGVAVPCVEETMKNKHKDGNFFCDKNVNSNDINFGIASMDLFHSIPEDLLEEATRRAMDMGVKVYKRCDIEIGVNLVSRNIDSIAH